MLPDGPGAVEARIRYRLSVYLIRVAVIYNASAVTDSVVRTMNEPRRVAMEIKQDGAKVQILKWVVNLYGVFVPFRVCFTRVLDLKHSECCKIPTKSVFSHSVNNTRAAHTWTTPNSSVRAFSCF